ncbi:hypothetical protein GGX14DRAFT_558503 [Mycena pura]|uniref:Uncharacterized protein n=1 Tax=Mycena pura TaxID=153505 RepID=A0AAD6YL05_9AGAR|nr:hypothetical protein GGX14DRAFT_558503 [Mycena pura]
MAMDDSINSKRALAITTLLGALPRSIAIAKKEDNINTGLSWIHAGLLYMLHTCPVPPPAARKAQAPAPAPRKAQAPAPAPSAPRMLHALAPCTPAPAHAPPAYAPCSHPAYVSCPQAYGAFALPPRVRVRALLARAPTYVPCPQTRAASGSAYVRTCVRIVHAPFPPPRARRASPARTPPREHSAHRRAVLAPRVRAGPQVYTPCRRPCPRACAAPAYAACSHAHPPPAHAPRPRTRTLLAHAPEYVRCVPAGACRERERMCTCHAYAPWPPSRTHHPHAQRPRPRKCRAVAPAPRMRRARVRAVPVRARRERECISAHVPRTHRARAVPGPAHAPSPEHSAHAPHVRTCLPARGARLRARTRRHGGRPCPRACTRTLLAHPAYVPCLAPRAARRERERMCTCHVYAPCPPSCTVPGPMPVYAPPAYAPCSRLYPRTRMRM